MMRRAGTLPEHMTGSISKSYCSAYCLEGQISVDLVSRRYPPTLRPSPGSTTAPRERGGQQRVTGRQGQKQ